MDAALPVTARPPRGWAALSGVGDVLVAASAPRFRAVSRSRIRASVRQAMALAVLAGVVDCAWLLPSHQGDAIRILGANGLVAAMAVASYLAMGRYRQLPAEAVAFGMLLMVDVSIAVVIGVDGEVSLLCAGYVLLLPPVVSLLIPWRTELHIVWLTAHGLAAVALSGLAPAEAIAIDGPRTLLALLLVASAGSVLGHLANLRARVVSFALIERVRLMHRQARRDEASLRLLNMRLEHVAWTDQLTGLGNRLALQRQLGIVRSRIERYGDRYALVMVDLDHFKAINDSHGHFAGDDVLRRVAAVLDAATRASDATYRFGGEEFVALVVIDGEREAAIVAERLRSAVERERIPHPRNPPHGVVTVSVGLTIVGAERISEPDDVWLKAADAALYEAKAQGRNRIAFR
jgi:diguanylate cyclase (GGDEF)-like protein